MVTSDPYASPADRYLAAKQRAAKSATRLAEFAKRYDFAFDDFQVAACEALEAGESVLVAAPTGSGKTIVGEFAVDLALHTGGRAFYTTPIKALSNQKYRDLGELFGSEKVGLLTGDTVRNGDAPVVVMTTEVLRNMIYEKSAALADLRHVVMDEVHYLADRQRGAVWEEVILQLPSSVLVTSLSATVSNAEEFGEWLNEVRGETAVIVEERRPVPLHQQVLTKHGMHDLFRDDQGDQPTVNPALTRLSNDFGRGGRRDGRDRGRSRRRGDDFVRRDFAVDTLASQGLLPAIVFIFSRKGCDDAVEQVLGAGVRLTTPAQRAEIIAFVDDACRSLPSEDLAVLEYDKWRDGLSRGVAAHHAGLLPLFKEVVEQLFCAGLVRLVYATETLALGINMPARTVVLERLVKWNGSAHVDVTAGEYTQITGRAGRRGIDHEGHAVTVWHNELDPSALAGLAAKRTYPLRSSFRPSYNMAVNLIDQMGYARARSMLEASFAQFQADAGVAGLAAKIRKSDEALSGYREAMTCHLGNFVEYADIRAAIAELEKSQSRSSQLARRSRVASQLAELIVGDIIGLSAGRRVVPAVVVSAADNSFGEPRPQILTTDRRCKRVSANEISHNVVALGRLKVPVGFDSRSANARRDLARRLADKMGSVTLDKPTKPSATSESENEIAELRAAMRAHPCHGCHDRENHARWANRYVRLARENEQRKRRMANETGSLARRFDAVCDVLTELGYLVRIEGEYHLTADARVLAGIYAEQDLLVAQSLRNDSWNQLTPEELAAVVAAIVFESRARDGRESASDLPPGKRVRNALTVLADQATDLMAVESRFRLANIAEPDDSFSRAAWGWCRGDLLEGVLEHTDIAVGDFVRWNRQILDLLSQVAAVAPDKSLRQNARHAADSMRRGIVAHSALGSEPRNGATPFE